MVKLSLLRGQAKILAFIFWKGNGVGVQRNPEVTIVCASTFECEVTWGTTTSRVRQSEWCRRRNSTSVGQFDCEPLLRSVVTPTTWCLWKDVRVANGLNELPAWKTQLRRWLVQKRQLTPRRTSLCYGGVITRGRWHKGSWPSNSFAQSRHEHWRIPAHFKAKTTTTNAEEA